MENKDIKNDGLLIAVGDQNINLDVLEKEYMDATGKIFNETKKAINNYDEFQKNNSTLSDLYRNDFNNFVSTLRRLGITLPNNVSEQYFRGESDKEVMDQIEKLNMDEENKQYLKEMCQYYKEKHTVPKENKIGNKDLEPLRKHIDVEEVFTQRFKCLILICKNKIYSEIQDDAKQLLGQIVAELKKNGLILNYKIKNEINKDMIKKYGNVASNLYEKHKSEMNKIFLKAAQIKNQNEVETILGRLEDEYQDKIKAEEERKKQEELKQQNNTAKDKTKTGKNDNTKEKNDNKKTTEKDKIATQNKTDGNKKNDEQHKSDPQKEIEKQEEQKKQRIREVAESSYFHEMLWNSFDNYRINDKKQSVEQANIYNEFRNLSMAFSNSIKTKYNTGTNLMVIENFQNEGISTFLVKYLLDDKFNKFNFEAKPREYKGTTGVNVANTTDSAIGYFAQEKIEQIATKSRPLIFNHPDYPKIAGAINGPSGNNDCFILAILSHLSSQEVEEIKKFVDKNKKRELYIKNNQGEIKGRTYDLFGLAGGNGVFISDVAKTISYMRAALAITIVDNWNRFPDGDPNRKLDIGDWNEFLALLGNGQRQISGECHMIAQAVANLTKRPYLLIYQSQVGQTGYFLATTDAVFNHKIKTYNGVAIGDFKFDAVYSEYVDKQGLNAQQSKCIEESNKILTELNEKLLKLIDDPNVISIRLDASGNLKTGNTNGHFWAIGRNYTDETLTLQKNNDVFNRLEVEENFKSNSDKFIRNLNRLGFTEKNKNMPSIYFLADGNNIQGLQDIIDFLQKLDSKNIKANFDKWFKNLLCSADGKIDENDENNFKDQIIKLFYSRDKNNNPYKDGNKVLRLKKIINNFSSCVPSYFHSKWFQIVYQPWPDPILFYTNTVIGKLANIKLGNDNGMKYFGYLIGKFVEAVKDQKTYDAWEKKFIDGDYLENILTRKNDIENDFSSEAKDKKFIDYDNQNIVDDLFKFIRLFDPSDLYVLIDVVEKGKNCAALKPLYNLSPKTVSKFIALFRKFVAQKVKSQNEIKNKKKGNKEENQGEIKNDENNNSSDIKEQDNIENAHINLIKLLGEINSQNPNSIFDQIISDSKSFEELRDSLKNIKSIVDQGGKNCDALKPLYNLSPKAVSKFFTLFREFVAKGKNQNEIKNDKNGNDIKEQDNIENAHINLIKLLGEINSQNPNGIFDQIISDSKSFGELRDSLKTIKSIVDQGDGAKDFLFALDFESFKKALSDFKQKQEKKGNKKEEEKKENNQQSLWDFIKDKNYERDDIQKIVSVSNSLDEIKNNLEELNNDELPMYLCKKYHEVENKKNIFWKLYIGIKSNISKIFSLFQKNDKNNINIKENIDDEQSLESIASALNKDGDEGENARIMFYSMSKNMGLKEKGKLWEKISSYMKEKEEENKKPERKKYEEEISTKTK